MTLVRASHIAFESKQAEVQKGDGGHVEMKVIDGALDTTSLTGQPIASVTHLGVACTEISVTHNSLGWTIAGSRLAHGTTRVLVVVPDVHVESNGLFGSEGGMKVLG